jgi:predicted permease
MRPPFAFRALLRLYPASFRGEYGDEMWRVYREHRREASGLAVPVLWLGTFFDTLVSAARTHGDILRQDLGYALRTFRHSPGFTATVMIVAALGIGANTAAFTLTDHVLIRPFPFADPSRLVIVWENQVAGGYGRTELSPAIYRDWKAMSTSLAGMAAYTFGPANVVGEGPPQRLEGTMVSAELLPLLGVQPALGRAFAADDDREGAPGTVLLSWGLWQSAYGGDPGVIGRSVSLDGESYAVIGVMPPSFSFPNREIQFWRPFRFHADAYDERDNNYLRVVARLAPGATLTQARAELDLVAERLERAYPKTDAGVRATVYPMRDELSKQSRVLVLALSGAALCVLLIACLNLANLLLARALVRRKELALRTALGAGRERLVRQLLTESLLLAFGGGVLGVLLAAGALPLIARLVPSTLPIAGTPALDLRVLAVAAGMTVLAALAFGVVPALRACRDVDPESLREGSRAGVGGHRARLRRALVVAEICASLVLLVSSGLLLRALLRLQDRDPGFRAEGVLTMRTALPLPKYDKTADRTRFYDRVLEPIRALPGVSGAAYISWLPMASPGFIWGVKIPGRVVPEGQADNASLRFVTSGFFSVMSIPVRAGRDIGAGDTADKPFVAVVSESFVHRYFAGADPIGKTFNFGLADRTIVGVVGDIRVRGLERDSEPQVYLSYRQVPDASITGYNPKELVIRSQVDRATLLPALRQIIAAADPEEPIANVRSLEEVVGDQTAPRRVQLQLIGTFAGLAFLLAGVGIYGLLSFGVSNRSQEIGVRMALGATPGSILRMVLREGAVLAAIGAVLGLALAYFAGRSLEAVLVGVAPTDVPTVAGALVLAMLMTLLGSVVPAWRAARVDPARVIRAD